jgi:hypothetical protein
VGLFGDQRPGLDDWRSAYFLEVYGQEGEEEGEGETTLVALNKEFGLRTAGYLYLEREGGAAELYDMKNDPDQLQNIASTADHALLDELSTLLHALQECSGSVCRTLDGTVLKQ